RHQRLAYQAEPTPGEHYLMVHAGLLPQWTTKQTMRYAAEVEAALQGESHLDFLAHMYGNLPNCWHDDLTGIDRLRVITNAMTRLRVCTLQGKMEFQFKGELADVPQDFTPWFDVPNRAAQDVQVIFGHWSAVGLQQRSNVYALDTGCLWGRQLTAMNLQTKEIMQVQSHPLDKPLKLKG
ncbi:MAG: symmetrical bis(5'-nucleosyl)-tetraphosphatase, partial [Methylotenera sp.]|nr:symmetrical bis(5'-nucleosyl)-tetraphosphatase [Methylotenera sp.]